MFSKALEGCNIDQPANLVTPDPVEYDVYADIWEKDRAEARYMLAEWFAWYCLKETDNTRRFYLVLTDVDTVEAREWQEKWQHVQLVTPGEFLKIMWPDVPIDEDVARRAGL